MTSFSLCQRKFLPTCNLTLDNSVVPHQFRIGHIPPEKVFRLSTSLAQTLGAIFFSTTPARKTLSAKMARNMHLIFVLATQNDTISKTVHFGHDRHLERGKKSRVSSKIVIPSDITRSISQKRRCWWSASILVYPHPASIASPDGAQRSTEKC